MLFLYGKTHSRSQSLTLASCRWKSGVQIAAVGKQSGNFSWTVTNGHCATRHRSCWALEYILIKEMKLKKQGFRCNCSGAEGFSIVSPSWCINLTVVHLALVLIGTSKVYFIPINHFSFQELTCPGSSAKWFPWSPSLMCSSHCPLSHSWAQAALYSVFTLDRANARILWAQSKKKEKN